LSLLISLPVALAAIYLVCVGVLWRFQERVAFQPPRPTATDAPGATRVEFAASDGAPLFALLVGACKDPSIVVLAFHGNADLAAWFVPWAIRASAETSACIVLAEYRGYAGLPGRPTYDGSSRDALAALQFVRERLGVPPERIVFFGHSLGSAVAAELAAATTPRALVLQSPFSSAKAMGARMLPGMAQWWRVLARIHFDTIRRVQSVAAPVFVSHGDRDVVIPVRMGREVFAAAKWPGELLEVSGAGHNDVADVGAARYWGWFRRACATHARQVVAP
jgi:uncharacterized protein